MMKVSLDLRVRSDCALELITNYSDHGSNFFWLVPLLIDKLDRDERVILGLLSLKEAFYGDSSSSTKLCDWQIIERLKDYFTFTDEQVDESTHGDDEHDYLYDKSFNLTDEDYVSIANMKYPDKYDRCIQIKISFLDYCNLGFIWKCKIVVSKEANLKPDEKYDYEKIMELQARDEIQIVEIFFEKDESQDQAILRVLIQETYEYNWMANFEKYNNKWFKYFLLYIKLYITPEFIDNCINAYIQWCKDSLEFPDDASFDREINSSKEFKHLTNEEVIKFREKIKCKTENSGFDKAIEIIIKYSECYKRIMSYA